MRSPTTRSQLSQADVWGTKQPLGVTTAAAKYPPGAGSTAPGIFPVIEIYQFRWRRRHQPLVDMAHSISFYPAESIARIKRTIYITAMCQSPIPQIPAVYRSSS